MPVVAPVLEYSTRIRTRGCEYHAAKLRMDLRSVKDELLILRSRLTNPKPLSITLLNLSTLYVVIFTNCEQAMGKLISLPIFFFLGKAACGKRI
jgi:hypothetical protein